MTGLVERLVDRTVRPAPVTPTVRPRRRSRFERVGKPSRMEASAGLVEEHVEVPAPVRRPSPAADTDTAPAPERVPTGEPARRSVRRIGPPLARERDHRITRETPAAPLVVSDTVEPPVESVAPETIERVVAPVAPPPIKPVREPRIGTLDAFAAPELTSTPTVDRVVEREFVHVPVVEQVVETEHVPIVIERPFEVAPMDRRRRPQRRTLPIHERRVVFDGGEPLGRHGLARLDHRDVITQPAIVEAVDRAAPDAPIHVHIGRLEVQRSAPPSPPPPAARPPAPVLGLDQYLAERPTRRSVR